MKRTISACHPNSSSKVSSFIGDGAFRSALICLIALMIMVAAPVTTWACSVCGGSLAQEKADAYTVVTGLLASLPVIMFAVLGIWIYQHYRPLEDVSSKD